MGSASCARRGERRASKRERRELASVKYRGVQRPASVKYRGAQHPAMCEVQRDTAPC